MLLFDEIEKAHRDVFNVLLQVLDDGRLTDGQGRTVNFKNTLIIMTSNLGSNVIQEMSTKSREEWEIEAAVRDMLKQAFRPEFLNRIDETIIFHPLGKDQLAKIVDIQLDHLRRRLETNEPPRHQEHQEEKLRFEFLVVLVSWWLIVFVLLYVLRASR